MTNVPIGPTTVLGGGVTVAAFVAAVVAFILGARDEGTIGSLVIGGVSLITTLIGRYYQAGKIIEHAIEVATVSPVEPKTYGRGRRAKPRVEASPHMREK